MEPWERAVASQSESGNRYPRFDFDLDLNKPEIYECCGAVYYPPPPVILRTRRLEERRQRFELLKSMRRRRREERRIHRAMAKPLKRRERAMAALESFRSMRAEIEAIERRAEIEAIERRAEEKEGDEEYRRVTEMMKGLLSSSTENK